MGKTSPKYMNIIIIKLIVKLLISDRSSVNLIIILKYSIYLRNKIIKDLYYKFNNNNFNK